MGVAAVRYAYWRAILAICLLLPVLQGRHAPRGRGGMSVVTGLGEVTALGAVEPAAPLSALDWTSIVLPVLAAGAIARLVWIGISLVRLRRLRRLGHPAVESAIHTELQSLIGARCEIRYVEALRQPVTFGFRRPVILLPVKLADRNADIQRAVLSHELFHVKRRDWCWLLLEEIVCAVFWFNPAVWWMVSRVQLAREVVVDELAVLATGRRRAYVEALVSFADETSLAPVAAFGGRRQLFNRIVLLSKEAVMSSHRLVFTCGVMIAALVVGSWQAVRAFPLTTVQGGPAVRQNTPGPLESRAKPITPENPIPRRVNYEDPIYPAEAEAAGARGSVTLMVTLDEVGRVGETRRLRYSVTTTNPPVSVTFSGSNPPDEERFLVNRSVEQSNAVRAIAAALTDAAVRSVQQWRYDPPAAGPIAFPVTLNFGAAGATAVQGATGIGVPGFSRVSSEGAIRVGGNIRTPTKLRDVRPVYPPEAQAARVSGLVIVEARIGPDGAVEDARILRSIPLLDQAALDAVMQWRFTPTLLNGNPVPVIMTVTVNFVVDQPEVVRDDAPDGVRVEAVPVEPATINVRPAPRGHGAIEVTPERRQMPEVVKEVKPSYTAEAMKAGIQGTVEMKVTVGVDGKVTDAHVIRSLSMLDEPALTAVREWEFKPLAQPVEVNIEMTFALRSGKR
jgi:protein TonB